MAKANVSFTRQKDRLRCDVHGIPDWEGFEKLVLFLEKNYRAKVLERIDGPDARRWKLQVEGVCLELQHEDPWGNVLVAVDDDADGVVRRIGEDLQGRLDAVDA